MENQNIQPPKDIPSRFDSRFVFSDTFIRVSRLINDEKIVENMIMSTPLPYVFTEEPIPLEFDYNLAEGLIKESYCKMCWTLTNKNVPSPLMIYFHLTENTIEKNVFVIFEIEIVNKKAIPEKYYEKINISFPKICKEMIQNIDKELKEYNKDIYHYESKIFNYPREKLWNVVLNYPLIMNKSGIIRDMNFETPMKEGSEISFITCEDNKFFKLKITKMKCDKEDKKWELNITPLKGPFDHYLQEWIFIELDENQTLLMNNSKYKEHINPDLFNKIAEQKKLTFKTIENILKSGIELITNNIINEFLKNVDLCGKNK